MQRILFSAFCSLLLAAVSLVVAGCDDADGDASPDAAARNPTAAEAAPEEYRDPEKIVARRAALRQHVQESFDESQMFAAAAEQYDIQEGYRPTAAYDPPPMANYDQASGRWTWRAFQCRNPACRAQTGKPLLFARVIPGVTLRDNGYPRFPIDAAMGGATCPRCNQTNVYIHTLPEVAARRAELETELAASRAARQRAREQRTAPSGDHRPPMQIMDEMTALPKLYLVPEQ
jgi:hypothetical protein